MKKLVLAILLFFIVSPIVLSQDNLLLKDKKDRIILPQKGDFAIGISANPFIDLVGNIFKDDVPVSFNLNLLNGNSLYGKYFLNSNTAVRAKLAISAINKKYEDNVPDDFNSGKEVTDVLNEYHNNTDFSFGIEKRRGKSRLQFSYGAELRLNFSSDKYDYNWGNIMSSTNTTPTSSDFNNHNADYVVRTIMLSNYSGTGIGLRGFAGVEYFIFPKVSLGGEAGLSYLKYIDGRYVKDTENWDNNLRKVKFTRNESIKNTYTVASDILNGQLYVLFYF